VAGGGDTVAALNRAGAAERFTYISTAGGAFLEWMEGKTLPGSRRWTRVEARRTHCLRHHNGQGPALRLKLSPTVFRPKTFEDR
jgi:hypothetical protein